VPVDVLCFHCKGHLTVEKVNGYSLQNTQNNSSSHELENLHEDRLELNKNLNMAIKCSVKDAILGEIKLISAKIESLRVSRATNPNKEPLWT
jgi:hypothetical protein